MGYYFSKKSNGNFEEVIEKVTTLLNEQGFGILTEIDVKETLKNKLNVDFRNYRILGACNPPFAHKALLAEDNIGLMLPCNVIVQETLNGKVEVAAIDPVASMIAVKNKNLENVAEEIRNRLIKVINEL